MAQASITPARASSTGQAFPLPAPPPFVPASSEGQPVKARSPHPEQARMRSQIACAHCRRHKVKCVNTGTDSVCKACSHQNRVCTYPEAGSSGPRRESIVDRTGEAPRVKNKRKTIGSGSQPLYPSKKQITPVQGSDPLDPTILTPQVWIELFEIFQQHYATDLPFLHPPTFRKEIQQLPPLLLLSFLTLTVRFHPALVERHGKDPIKAAEYYRNAVKPHVAIAINRLSNKPKLATVQAFLMLGLHDLGMARGGSAWRLIKDAISCAIWLNLHQEPHLDEEPDACATSRPKTPQDHSRSGSQTRNQAFIDKEIERRTFWSCFIIDRYLSFNKSRPPTIRIEETCVQLPCSETAFIFGHEVDTMMLNETERQARDRFRVQNQLRRVKETSGSEQSATENGIGVNGTHSQGSNVTRDEPKQELGENEGILSRFIKAIDLLASVLKWACSGGRRRRREMQFGPWNPESTFRKLELRLKELQENLPNDLVISSDNIHAHIDTRSSRHYTMMHIGHLLCNIALYREYMAFLPFNIPKPIGPLDEPKIPESELRNMPPGEDYWVRQARSCFGAARNLIDLLQACKMANVLVQTPLTGFATWQAVTCAVYCGAFPAMDVDSSMTATEARISIQMLKDMQKALPMVDGWCKTEQALCELIEKERFRRGHGKLEGYGLNLYKEMESMLKEFGHPRKYEDDGEDEAMVDSSPEPKEQEAATDSGSIVPKGEDWEVDARQRADNYSGFTPVNHKDPSAVKAEVDKNVPGISNGFTQKFGEQMVAHAAQASTSEHNHSYDPVSYNQQHPPSYRPYLPDPVHRKFDTGVVVQDNNFGGSFQIAHAAEAFSGGYNYEQVEPTLFWHQNGYSIYPTYR